MHDLTCTDLSKLNPFCTVYAESKLPQLLFIFQKGVHRAAVVDNNNKVIGIVSQSDVIRFLAKTIHLYDKLSSWRNKDIGLGQKNSLFTINTNARAIHGFYQMKLHKISAVGVVDHEGVLVGNLSVSSLRVQ